MSPSPLVIRFAFAIAVVLAWVLARRAPLHRAAALALSWFFVIDCARPVLAGAVPPLCDAALFLAAYAIQAALAVVVFTRAPPTLPKIPDLFSKPEALAPRQRPGIARELALVLVLLAWASAILALSKWWASAPRIYTVAFYGSLAIQLATLIFFLARRGRGHALPDPAQGVGVLLTISAIADATGPWRAAQPHFDWIQGDRVAVLTWILVSAWETWQWTASYPQRSS